MEPSRLFGRMVMREWLICARSSPEEKVFAFLHDSRERFNAVKLAEFGHAIYWLDNDDDEIDSGADSLRCRAGRQAEILRLAS
jgi:hypothetical protein